MMTAYPAPAKRYNRDGRILGAGWCAVLADECSECCRLNVVTQCPHVHKSIAAANKCGERALRRMDR